MLRLSYCNYQRFSCTRKRTVLFCLRQEASVWMRHFCEKHRHKGPERTAGSLHGQAQHNRARRPSTAVAGDSSSRQTGWQNRTFHAGRHSQTAAGADRERYRRRTHSRPDAFDPGVFVCPGDDTDCPGGSGSGTAPYTARADGHGGGADDSPAASSDAE